MNADGLESDKEIVRINSATTRVKFAGFVACPIPESVSSDTAMSMLIWGSKNAMIARDTAELFREFWRQQPRGTRYLFRADDHELCITPVDSNGAPVVHPSATFRQIVFSLDHNGLVDK